jgi:hypothetical protein
MQTVVIQITEAAKGGRGFTVKLRASESGDPAALSPVRGGVATIPATLAPESPVLAPNGNPLTVADVMTLYETSGDKSAAYGAIGEFLYRLLARGKLAKAWSDLRDAAPTRTLVDIATTPAMRDLHRLPWELMHDPDAGLHFFVDQRSSILRGEPRLLTDNNPAVQAAARKFVFPTDDWPLRVLVIYSAGPEYALGAGTASGIGASVELDALETLFAASRFDIEYEVLEHPSRAAIVAKCASIDPHIFHFIGHAEAGAQPAQHRLMIYGPGGDPDIAGGPVPGYEPWTLYDIRNDLQTLPLRLAVLNACRTAAAAGAVAPVVTVAPFDNIAESMLQRGTLGVIGMQGDIPGDVAAVFSKALYEALVKGVPVDLAVGQARWIASRDPNRTNYIDRRDWSFPMLRTRVMPDLVLPTRPPALGAPKFSGRPERFVGHLAPRRLVRQTVKPSLGTARKNGGRVDASPHLVAIVGDQGVGKSHLAKWCAELCAERGLQIAYVQFGGVTIDLLGALRWIRDGQRPPSPGSRIKPIKTAPLPQGAFRRFTQKLNARMHGVISAEGLPDPAEDVTDDNTAFTDGKSSDLSFVEDTFHDFRIALGESAKARPLVLVLDQVEVVESTAREQLIPTNLLAPIARGQVTGVCSIVVARTADYKAIQATLSDASVQASQVDVSHFKRGEYDRIARHLCQQWKPDMYENVRESLPRILKQYGEPRGWKGALLERVDRLCSGFA